MYPLVKFSEDLYINGVLVFNTNEFYNIADIDKEYIYIKYASDSDEVGQFPRSERGKLFKYVG